MNVSTPLLVETTPYLLLFWLAEASRTGPAEGTFHSRRRKSMAATRAVSKCIVGVPSGGHRPARDSGQWRMGSWTFNGWELRIGVVAMKSPGISIFLNGEHPTAGRSLENVSRSGSCTTMRSITSGLLAKGDFPEG